MPKTLIEAEVRLCFQAFMEIGEAEAEKFRLLIANATEVVEKELRADFLAEPETLEKLHMLAAAKAYADYFFLYGTESESLKIGDISLSTGQTSQNAQAFFLKQRAACADFLTDNTFFFGQV